MNEKRGFPKFLLGGVLGMLGALFRRTGTRAERAGRDVESLLHLPGTPAPMHQ